MRGIKWRTVLAAAVAASGLLVAAGAQAHDDDRWRWDHRHDHGEWHHVPERRVVVERQPVVVERRPVIVERRPVVVAPPPVVMAAPVYAPPPVASSLNLNFNIPLN